MSTCVDSPGKGETVRHTPLHAYRRARTFMSIDRIATMAPFRRNDHSPGLQYLCSLNITFCE